MKESTTNKEARNIYTLRQLITFSEINKTNSDIDLLSDYKKHISFRINRRYEASYINVCDVKDRGYGIKYSNFPTIQMHNRHLVDMAKVILEALEPEALVNHQTETAEFDLPEPLSESLIRVLTEG